MSDRERSRSRTRNGSREAPPKQPVMSRGHSRSRSRTPPPPKATGRKYRSPSPGRSRSRSGSPRRGYRSSRYSRSRSRSYSPRGSYRRSHSHSPMSSRRRHMGDRYIIMMSSAVLTLSPHGGWTTSIKYSLRKPIHGAMQAIGAALAITGSAIVMSRIPSWASKSVHGIFGIMALACLCLSFVLGILNVFSSRMPSLERAIKIGHTFSGVFTIVFAFLSLIMGFDILLTLRFNGVGIMGMVVTALAMIGVVTSALITAMRRMCC